MKQKKPSKRRGKTTKEHYNKKGLKMKKQITFKEGLYILKKVANYELGDHCTKCNLVVAKMLSEKEELFYGDIPDVKFFRNLDQDFAPHEWAEVDGIVFDLMEGKDEICVRMEENEEYDLKLNGNTEKESEDLWKRFLAEIPEE